MSETARAAFRAVLEYEKPPGNGWVQPILMFAEARGFCAHPSDWVSSADSDHQFPDIYQPQADWLGRLAGREGVHWHL